MTNNPLAICGGLLGIIRIIDIKKFESCRHLIGHGGAINDLKVSPHDHNLLLSSSEDYSLRLWNLKTNICIAKFGGESGHRDQVLSADFYLLSDKYFVSSGMDHSIKIWSLNDKKIRKAIKSSYNWKELKATFPMESRHFPVFTTRAIHTNYVDCVQFLGRYLLSKSCNNEIICSKPDVFDNKEEFIENKVPNEAITRLGAFKTEDNTLWFIKFSMDFEQELMSVGNGKGVAYVWDLTVDNPYEYEPLVLSRKKCTTIIRQTSFSKDGKTLICVCDDSSIWRWDISRE